MTIEGGMRMRLERTSAIPESETEGTLVMVRLMSVLTMA